MSRIVIIATTVAAVALGLALAVAFPPPTPPRCEADEIAVQEKSNGPYYCVKARRL